MAKILLVEDDNNLREIYEARLVAEGYDIASARDGEEALVVAKQEMPDLVISDVMMPKISGFEMLDILRNTDGLQTVKVIMLTALGQSEDQSRADSLGADRYLVKSQVTLEDIVNAAHDLLIEAGAINAPAAAPVEAPAQVGAPPTFETVAAPAPVAPPSPVAAPVVQPITEPAPQQSVIPMASAPPELPEDMPVTSTSMPPTPVSTIPTDDLSFAQPVVAPPVSNPDPVVPAPAPVAAAPAATPPTPIGVASDEQQTNAQESAAVEHQIEEFVATQTGQPEPTVEPVAEPVAVAVEPETTTPEQEQALQDAVKNLGGQSTTAPETLVIPVTDEAATPHGKVIAPLTPSETAEQASSKLDQLLAAEAAEEARQAAAPALQPQAVQPNQQPAPVAAEQPKQPATAAKTPAPNDELDPNSIAL